MNNELKNESPKDAVDKGLDITESAALFLDRTRMKHIDENRRTCCGTMLVGNFMLQFDADGMLHNDSTLGQSAVASKNHPLHIEKWRHGLLHNDNYQWAVLHEYEDSIQIEYWYNGECARIRKLPLFARDTLLESA